MTSAASANSEAAYFFDMRFSGQLRLACSVAICVEALESVLEADRHSLEPGPELALNNASQFS